MEYYDIMLAILWYSKMCYIIILNKPLATLNTYYNDIYITTITYNELAIAAIKVQIAISYYITSSVDGS